MSGVLVLLAFVAIPVYVANLYRLLMA